MGKKTNWTLAEDQALCRAWICASDGALAHDPEQKATAFWNVVHQLFLAELETTVDRPVSGLKIRWSRVNRDVQRFAIIYSRVHAAAAGTPPRGPTTNGIGEPVVVPAVSTPTPTSASAHSPTPPAVLPTGDLVELEAEHEQQLIDDAVELFVKEQGSKFSFVACWRMLRFSPRWLRLLANSTGVSVGIFSATPVPALVVDGSGGRDIDASAEPLVVDATNTAAQAQHKRRLASLLEAHKDAPATQLRVLAATISAELKRQSELMEEANAIALFRLELDHVEDAVARDYFTALRRRYAKRMRLTTPDATMTVVARATEDEERLAAGEELMALPKQTADL